MPVTATEYKYVELDERNVPFIAGTTMKVIEIVTAQIAYGWSPEEIHLNHPYLSMSQIHSALAYYWDHKPELDADIKIIGCTRITLDKLGHIKTRWKRKDPINSRNKCPVAIGGRVRTNSSIVCRQTFVRGTGVAITPH